jgi:hypothetical protein
MTARLAPAIISRAIGMSDKVLLLATSRQGVAALLGPLELEVREIGRRRA